MGSEQEKEDVRQLVIALRDHCKVGGRAGSLLNQPRFVDSDISRRAATSGVCSIPSSATDCSRTPVIIYSTEPEAIRETTSRRASGPRDREREPFGGQEQFILTTAASTGSVSSSPASSLPSLEPAIHTCSTNRSSPMLADSFFIPSGLIPSGRLIEPARHSTYQKNALLAQSTHPLVSHRLASASLGLLPCILDGYVEVCRLEEVRLIRMDSQSGKVCVEHGRLPDEVLGKNHSKPDFPVQSDVKKRGKRASNKQPQTSGDANGIAEPRDEADDAYADHDNMDNGWEPTNQPVMEFYLSDLAGPVVVDDTRVFLPLGHAPTFSVRSCELGGDFHTYVRVFPDRKLGLGLSLVVCLDIGSLSVLQLLVLPILRHFAVRCLFGRVSSANDTNISRRVRRFSNMLFTMEGRKTRGHLKMDGEKKIVKGISKNEWSNPGKKRHQLDGSQPRDGEQVNATFLLYLQLIGENMTAVTTSAVLYDEVWDALAAVPASKTQFACERIAELIQAHCFVPPSAILDCIRIACDLIGDECSTQGSAISPRFTVSLTGVRCTTGKDFRNVRGVQAWYEACRQAGFHSTVATLVFRDDDDTLPYWAESIVKRAVRQIFEGRLRVQAKGGGWVRLVPLHWSMSMLRNAAMIVVSEPWPGYTKKFLNERFNAHTSTAEKKHNNI